MSVPKFRVALIALALFLAPIVDGLSTDFVGIVRVNTFDGTPLPNVQATVDGLSNTTLSGQDGTFNIIIPGKRPGELVSLHLHKEGWELVNDSMRDVVIPNNTGAKSPDQTFVMCHVGEREHWAIQYFRLLGEEAIQRSYNAKITLLESKGRDASKELLEMKTSMVKARQFLDLAAEQMAHIRLDTASAEFRSALSLFKQGKISEAIERLKDIQIKGQLSEGGRELQDSVNCWLLKAELFVVEFDTLDAEKTFKEALRNVPLSGDANTGYGIFLHTQNRFREAQDYFIKALSLNRLIGTPELMIRTLNNMANGYSDENKISEAVGFLEEALSICRTLQAKDPSRDMPLLAITLENLAASNDDLGRAVASASLHTEALDIWKRLVSRYPGLYEDDEATALTNLCAAYLKCDRLEESVAACRRAIEIRRMQSRSGVPTSIKGLGDTLITAASAMGKAGYWNEAENNIEEALALFRTLERNNPVAFSPDLALAHGTRGLLLLHAHKLTEAKKEFTEGLGIFKKLAGEDRAAYTVRMLTILQNVSLAYHEEGKNELSLSYTGEAIEMCRQLATTEPTVYNSWLGDLLDNMGSFYSDLGKDQKAIDCCQEGLRLRRLQMISEDSGTHRSNLATSLNNLGSLERKAGRFENALRLQTEALAIRLKLASSDENEYLFPYGESLQNTGNVYLDMGQWKAGLDLLEEAVKVQTKLVGNHRDFYLPKLAFALDGLGLALQQAGRTTEAMQRLEEAVNILREWKQMRADGSPLGLGRTLVHLGMALSDSDRFEEAFSTNIEALKIFRDLGNKSGRDYRLDTAECLNNIGNLGGKQLKLVEGLVFLNEAEQISSKLAKENPEAYMRNFASTMTNVGAIYLKMSKWKLALTRFDAALRIYRELEEKNNGRYQADIGNTLNNKAICLSSGGSHISEASKIYEETLAIRRKLAIERNRLRKLDLSDTLNNFGFHLLTSEPKRSREQFVEAVDILRGFPEKNPELMSRLGFSLLGLAKAHLICGDPFQARENLLEAGKIFATLSQSGSSSFEWHRKEVARLLKLCD